MSSLIINEIQEPSKGMIQLSREEQEMTLGGDCIYASLTYSTGAVLQNGQTCRSDGTWSMI